MVIFCCQNICAASPIFLWEVIINWQANINRAIFYSFIGEIETAKAVLNKEWALLYVGFYLFSIWDSYRTTVDLNNVYKLAAREDAQINPMVVSALGINYLDKRTPLNAFLWSLFMPGAGQLYIHRLATAAFILIWLITVFYLSKTLPAIHYSFTGQFEQAKSVLNIQWLLNLPSVFLFPAYDAYINTVENNKLYDWEQAKFLKRQYQSSQFKMPFQNGKHRGDGMYVLASFEHSNYLELAITAVQMKGIPKENILAAPLDKRGEERKLFDSMHYSDGLSLIDFAMIFGTILMLLGTIYGFLWAWGPIWWGLIGLFLGVGLGIGIKLMMTKRNTANRLKAQKASEVFLIFECEKQEAEMIKNILWGNHALGVTKLDLTAGAI